MDTVFDKCFVTCVLQRVEDVKKLFDWGLSRDTLVEGFGVFHAGFMLLHPAALLRNAGEAFWVFLPSSSGLMSC